MGYYSSKGFLGLCRGDFEKNIFEVLMDLPTVQWTILRRLNVVITIGLEEKIFNNKVCVLYHQLTKNFGLCQINMSIG